VSARRKGRKRALGILYAADVRELPVHEILEQERLRSVDEPERAASWTLAESIVSIAVDRFDEIDALIAQVSSWPLERMPAIDRALVRMATAELLGAPETPTAVIIAEAGELATEYSTEESRGFLQGVLGTLAEKARHAS